MDAAQPSGCHHPDADSLGDQDSGRDGGRAEATGSQHQGQVAARAFGDRRRLDQTLEQGRAEADVDLAIDCSHGGGHGGLAADRLLERDRN